MTNKIYQNFPMCSVIVLNYNGKNHLKRCLNSLLKQNYQNYEIILVDNASTDGSVNFVKKNYPRIRIIENKKNLGYAEGNNTGIRVANGEYIVILNNDTEVDNEWLRELTVKARDEEKVGVVGGKIYWMNEPNKIQSIGGKLHIWNNFLFFGTRLGANEIDVGQYEEQREIDYAMGCAFLIKKKVLDKIGLFDSEYFIYNEEIDLQYQVKKIGYKITYTPKAKLWHLGSMVVSRESYKKIYLTQRNKIRFIFKNFELYLILWNLFSQTLHFTGKIILSVFKKNFSTTVRAIYDAVKWNISNMKDTLKVRNELKKLFKSF